MMPMIVRRDAAQAAVSRFKGGPLIWGKTDCVRIGAFTLRQMRQRVSLAKAGSYSTAQGAVRALKRAGFDSLEQGLNAQGLIRIKPAATLPADFVLMPGDGGLPALWVALGNGRGLGYHEDADTCVVVSMNLDVALGAWSTYRG